MGLEGVRDVHRVRPEFESAEHEQPLGPVVVAGVDLQVGGREPEPPHAHHPDGVHACPGPDPGAEQAPQGEAVVGGREPGAGAEPEHRGGADRDPRDAEQETSRPVEAGEEHRGQETDGADQPEDHRAPGRRPRDLRVVHRLRPHWGRMTSV
ncbi:hypothetical protein GCM10023201_12960 [Actinomycetospora corticicola]